MKCFYLRTIKTNPPIQLQMGMGKGMKTKALFFNLHNDDSMQ